MSTVLKQWIGTMIVTVLFLAITLGAWKGSTPAFSASPQTPGETPTPVILSPESFQVPVLPSKPSPNQGIVLVTLPETYIYTTTTVVGPVFDIFNYDWMSTIFTIQRENQDQEVYATWRQSNSGDYWENGGGYASAGSQSDLNAVKMGGTDNRAIGRYARISLYATTSDPYTVTATSVFYP